MTVARKDFLLDTNIVLHAVRDSPLWQQVDGEFQLTRSAHRPWLSAVTVGEILALAERNGWGEKRKHHLEALLRELLILDINLVPILRAYAEVDVASRQQPMGQNDKWIAATARATGACLLTTDKDFQALPKSFLDLTWVNPEVT